MSTIGLEAYRNIRNRGAYDSGTAYIRDDLVTYQGSAYICNVPTQGNLPTEAAYWGLLVQKGDTGPEGPPGTNASYFISAKASAVPGYGSFTTTPHGLAETEYAAELLEPDTEYLLAQFLTNGNFNEPHVPPGLWAAHLSGRVSATGGVTVFVFKVYKRDLLGAETLLFSFESSEVNNTATEIIETDYVKLADDPLTVTDELVFKVFGKTTSGADRTLYLTVDGTGHASHVETTLGSGFDPAASQIITGQYTFVVTNGKSFQIVDNAELPANGFGYFDHDASVSASALMAGFFGTIASAYFYVDDSGGRGHVLQFDNDNGSISSTFTLLPNGASYQQFNVDAINLNTGTALLLGKDASAALEAVTLQQLQAAVKNTVSPVSSAAGVITLDLSLPVNLYTLALTEDVSSWVISNPPAAGEFRDVFVRVTQHASSAKTVESPASSGKTAGGTWTVSSTLSSVETLGLRVFSDGAVELYPSGVFA